MWTTRTSTLARTPRPFRHWRMVRVCGLVLLAATAAVQAQDRSSVMTLKTGLHTVPPGHILQVLMTETGSREAATAVTIEFRDASDQRRGFVSRTLTRTEPVRLRVKVPAAGGAMELRAIVVMRPMVAGVLTEPVAGLEDLDPNSISVVPKVVCAPNPSVGSGAEGNCDGWQVTRLSADGSNSLPD